MGWRADSLIPLADSADLKALAKLLGGSGSLRKDECIRIVLAGLNQPEKVKVLLEHVAPFERATLALLNRLGGLVDERVLGVSLRTLGVPLPTSAERRADDYDLIAALKRHGILFYRDGRSRYGYGSSMYDYVFVPVPMLADERLLAQADALEIVPFPISPAASPDSIRSRRPQNVTLDLIAVLQAIDSMGGLRLTKSKDRSIRAGDLSKLSRALNWEADTSLDGLTFPSAALGYVGAFWRAGIVAEDEGVLRLNRTIDWFAEKPYIEQVRLMLNGFVDNVGWDEWPQQRSWEMTVSSAVVPIARRALLMVLLALPGSPDSRDGSFYSIDDVCQAWFERVGERFSLGHDHRYLPYRAYGQTESQYTTEMHKWRAKLRDLWRKRERMWMERAFSTWLYALGLVELGVYEQQGMSVRLSELGRALLGLDEASRASLHAAPAPAANSQPAWVVQPNFEVLVYLDHVTSRQIAFLEQHAERRQSQQHTAQYRLTRESVYRALEGGSTLDRLLDGLQEGSGNPLPQNVAVELRQWAALRDQIALRRVVKLAEFVDEASRQKTIDSGVEGEPVGDRFLILRPDEHVRASRRVDYAAAPVKCLAVTETGRITLDTAQRDLLIEAQLTTWAERISENEWQLSARSVAAACTHGTQVGDLFNLLGQRLTNSMPSLLMVALRAWGGADIPAAIGTATVLRCPSAEAFAAIVGSPRLRRYVRAQLGPDALLVDTAHVDVFVEVLAWAGLRMTDELTITDRQ
jgi:hypothetical protein